jgi:hypothetical protein
MDFTDLSNVDIRMVGSILIAQAWGMPAETWDTAFPRQAQHAYDRSSGMNPFFMGAFQSGQVVSTHLTNNADESLWQTALALTQDGLLDAKSCMARLTEHGTYRSAVLEVHVAS